MTFNEIKRYLYSDCVVRNEEFEYKTEGKNLFCRDIGTVEWRNVYQIGEYEKRMDWELVGKKDDNEVDDIKQFISYAEREGIISIEISNKLLKFAKYYNDLINT